MHSRLILGGPGAGKTSALLKIVQDERERGVPISQIAFCSFSKKAAEEGKARAAELLDLPQRKLYYFRTIHSIAFVETGTKRDEVYDKSTPARKELTRLVGESMFGTLEDDEDARDPRKLGLRMHFIDCLARNTFRPLRDTYNGMNDWDITWPAQERFSSIYHPFLKRQGITDFVQILERYVAMNRPLPVRVAIVDEAQDLTPLQWACVRVAFRDVERIYYAGDDDQAIHAWMGADLKTFLSLGNGSDITGNGSDITVLPKSHRLPPEIFEFARTIALRIRNRYEKPWGPRDGNGTGEVTQVRNVEDLDLTQGSHYLLARNNFFLGPFYEGECRRQGVLYETKYGRSVPEKDAADILAYVRMARGEPVEEDMAERVAYRLKVRFTKDGRKLYWLKDLGINGDPPKWHEAFKGMSAEDRAYYHAVHRRGENLLGKPKVFIGTCHSVKGGEAGTVVLAPDQTWRTAKGMMGDMDQEHRVFYVGASRARERLFILDPRSDHYYPL